MSNENEKKNKRTKPKKKNKNSKKKVFTVLKVILIVLLLGAFIGAGTVGGLVYGVVKDTPEINPSYDINTLNENSKIYDANGTLIEEVLTEEKRTIVSLDQMSPYIEDAFIAVEDERFRDHFGIDLRGIARAIVVDIKTRSLDEGASTITQQLVRNLYLTKEKAFTRKISEMYLAVKMEKEISKDDILEAYLNTIYLGQGSYGVQAASKTYFSKDAKDLTIAEAALLAGITKNPTRNQLYSRLDPETVEEDNPHIVGTVEVLGKTYVAVFNDDIVSRQQTILSKMKEQGMISESEYNEAINEDVVSLINPGQMKNDNISTSYFNDYVKDKVKEDLINKAGYSEEEAENALYTHGLKIYTTIDIDMQKKIEGIYESFSQTMSKGGYNKLINIPFSNGNIVDSEGKILYYKKESLLNEEGNLIIPKDSYTLDESGNLTIKSSRIYYANLNITDYYTMKDGVLYTHPTWSLDIPKESWTVNKEDKSFTISSSYLNENKNFYTVTEDNTLLITSERFYADEKGVIQPQSAITIMDQHTGQVKAIVGGRDDEGQRIFNRATNGARQPGSAMKPLGVYTPALDNGFTAASVIDDVPHYDKGRLWPKNYNSNAYYGLTPLREAVRKSYNVSAVKFLEKVGTNTSMDYLARFGIINTENPSDDTFIMAEEAKGGNFDEDSLGALALGGMTKGVSPLRMTAAYGALANKGIYTEPIVYTKIENNKGEVIIDNKPKQNTVVNPQVAYMMTNVLESVVKPGGTGTRARIPGISVAGKTGTTSDKADTWFVGYSPYYTAAVWIGNDSPAIRMTESSAIASHLWGYIMNQVHDGLDNARFDVPDGLVRRDVCIDSGKLPTELCYKDPRGSRVRTELFVSGTQPRERCDVHVEAKVDTSTGKIATEYCPEDLVKSGVFIQRPIPYDPAKNKGIKPRDYQYQVINEVCDEHNEKTLKDYLDDLLGDDEEDEDEDGKDKPEPPPEEDDPEITKKTEKKEEEIAFNTIKTSNPDEARNGEPGIKEVTYEVTYTDGKETSRKKLGEKVIKNPVDKVVYEPKEEDPPPEKPE
ncbi:PBP1A family penicillin-binding protein [Clostridium sp. D2Q-11]|uniref:PBP1A family penicillin-binding protein n=1 Tax=Anaeromonas frigoriresistens TaxID=2683708 RepID=A0A942V493_9FIRM|nr:PBP1A family penicillin-binding protein [Anaeromonas frigoriresistens]MBS4539627.1 PBP1A family penicillin-binding protein [Anaeromonas frigoriresistens]